jgi:hypothetical protein
MKKVPARSVALTAVSLLLACAGGGGQAPGGGGPVDNVGSTPPARPSGPVSTNPPGVQVSPSTPGAGGAGGGTRPPDGGARRDGPSVADAPPAAVCPMTVMAAGNDGLIDDFNDNNATVRMVDMRMGLWEIHTSPTTMIAGPAMAPAPELTATGGFMNSRALRLRGTEMDATSYGAGANVYFVDAMNGCYDASAYARGVSFSIKGAAGTVVAVVALTGDMRAAGAPNTVGWYRAFLPPFAANQVNTVRTVTLAWTDFKPSYGTPPGPNADPKYLLGFQFATAPRPAGTANDAGSPGIGAFDFTIDQVQLVR